MKYIRTKDKLLIAPELYDDGGAVLCSDPPQYETRNAKNEWGCVEAGEIIKTADTIEELCDEIVLVDKYGTLPTHCIDRKNQDLEYMIKWFAKFAIFYGAIWTDKGLIYVAKINKQGELELL